MGNQTFFYNCRCRVAVLGHLHWKERVCCVTIWWISYLACMSSLAWECVSGNLNFCEVIYIYTELGNRASNVTQWKPGQLKKDHLQNSSCWTQQSWLEWKLNTHVSPQRKHKQTSFTSSTEPRRQGGQQEHAQCGTNHYVTSGCSCRRLKNVSILSFPMCISWADDSCIEKKYISHKSLKKRKETNDKKHSVDCKFKSINKNNESCQQNFLQLTRRRPQGSRLLRLFLQLSCTIDLFLLLLLLLLLLYRIHHRFQI